MTKASDRYFPTHEIEKLFINNIWYLADDELNSMKEVILPKGTVEIIFNFSDEINYHNPATQMSKKLPTTFINGINFKPFELTKIGRQEFIGIQLNGIGLRLLFNMSAKEFNNSVYEGNLICPQLDSLADELSYNLTFLERVVIILDWIRKKSQPSGNQTALDRFRKLYSLKCINDLTVKKISEEFCLSDRQLRRYSLDWLGMSTEEFILYNRYLTSLHLLHHHTSTLTQVGLEAGYYDQSHFIREFKSYTDMTPKQYRGVVSEFPGHYFI